MAPLLRARCPYAVIPAQAGIQTGLFLRLRRGFALESCAFLRTTCTASEPLLAGAPKGAKRALLGAELGLSGRLRARLREVVLLGFECAHKGGGVYAVNEASSIVSLCAITEGCRDTGKRNY